MIGDICSVVGCNNTSWDGKNKQFYAFPQVNPIREKWISFCSNLIHWQPKKTSKICDDHFEDSVKRLSKDKWVPTIKFESTSLKNKITISDSEKNFVTNTQKIIKISGLKKLQILKPLPEKVITNIKTENTIQGKILTDPLKKTITHCEPSQSVVPIKIIQSNKIKSISTKDLLKFDCSSISSPISSKASLKVEYLKKVPSISLKMNENPITYDDNSKVIAQNVTTQKNVIKLTTPIKTIKNISIPGYTQQHKSANATETSNMPPANLPLKLPLTSTVDIGFNFNSNDAITHNASQEKMELTSSALKPISVVSITGKKLTLTPIAIAPKAEHNKNLQPPRISKMNSFQTTKRSIQFIPVQPKIRKLEANEHLKHLSLSEMVDIINKNSNKESSIRELAMEYNCSQEQVQQIITNHQHLLEDEQRYDMENTDLYNAMLDKQIIVEGSDINDHKSQVNIYQKHDNLGLNGIFDTDLLEEISTYEDAYIHLLALIKFCKSVGGLTDSIKHLNNLKDFLIEEMCSNNKK